MIGKQAQQAPKQVEQPKYVYHKTVLERGWSKTMIERFLQEPDKLVVNPHYPSRPKAKLYRLDRVEMAEKTLEFQEELAAIKLRSEKRRASAEKREFREDLEYLRESPADDELIRAAARRVLDRWERYPNLTVSESRERIQDLLSRSETTLNAERDTVAEWIRTREFVIDIPWPTTIDRPFTGKWESFYGIVASCRHNNTKYEDILTQMEEFQQSDPRLCRHRIYDTIKDWFTKMIRQAIDRLKLDPEMDRFVLRGRIGDYKIERTSD